MRKMRCLLNPLHIREILTPMPEVHFTVRLPDGVTRDCYSPSTVIRSYFKAGEKLNMREFLIRSRKGLSEASERVRAKFGFGCGSAAAQLDDIERWSAGYSEDAIIQILEI